MEKAFCWMCELNLSGLRAEMDFANRSLKSQMKQANRAGAARTLIVGEDELNKGRAVLRDMTTREQTEIPVDRPVERIMTIFQDQVKE